MKLKGMREAESKERLLQSCPKVLYSERIVKQFADPVADAKARNL